MRKHCHQWFLLLLDKSIPLCISAVCPGVSSCWLACRRIWWGCGFRTESPVIRVEKANKAAGAQSTQACHHQHWHCVCILDKEQERERNKWMPGAQPNSIINSSRHQATRKSQKAGLIWTCSHFKHFHYPHWNQFMWKEDVKIVH